MSDPEHGSLVAAAGWCAPSETVRSLMTAPETRTRPTRKQLKARIRELERELALRGSAGPVVVELTQPDMPGGRQVVTLRPGISQAVTVHAIRAAMHSGTPAAPTYILIDVHLKAWRTP